MLIIRSWNKLAIKFSPAAADWCRNLRAIDEIATYSTNFNFKRQNSRFFQVIFYLFRKLKSPENYLNF